MCVMLYNVAYCTCNTWSTDNTHLLKQALEALVINQVDFDYTCINCYKMLFDQTDVLRKIHSSKTVSLHYCSM